MFTYAFGLAALASLASSSSINNAQTAAVVLDSAVQLTGTYTLTNLETGDVLSYSGTDFTTNSGGGNVVLQSVSASGMDGTAISDGTSRCAAAQWGFQSSDAYDHAAVAYACAVGPFSDAGTATLEKTKQVWTFVPAGANAADFSGSSSSSGSSNSEGVNLAAKQTTKSTSSGSKKTSSSSKSSKVDPKDRSTWVCKHPGSWLAKHQGYVVEHTECKDELAAYLAQHSRKSKRWHHADLAVNIQRRASNVYYIITTDHLKDMTTRAIGSTYKETYGGWQSQVLVAWDKTDKSQMWVVQKA